MEANTKTATGQASKFGPASGRPIDFTLITKNDVQRFAAKCSDVDPETGCIEWLAGRFADGYGEFRWQGRKVKAHRFYFVLGHQRDIQPGMVLDHLCRNRGCVAPWHLREVTPRENTLADGSLALAKHNAEKTHCERGHELVGENLVKAQLAVGRRECRACANARSARGNARKRGEHMTDEELQAFADEFYARVVLNGENVA